MKESALEFQVSYVWGPSIVCRYIDISGWDTMCGGFSLLSFSLCVDVCGERKAKKKLSCEWSWFGFWVCFHSRWLVVVIERIHITPSPENRLMMRFFPIVSCLKLRTLKFRKECYFWVSISLPKFLHPQPKKKPHESHLMNYAPRQRTIQSLSLKARSRGSTRGGDEKLSIQKQQTKRHTMRDTIAIVSHI